VGEPQFPRLLLQRVAIKMGNMLDAPKTDKDTDVGEVDLGGKVMYGASGMQGYRPEMEDQHTCVTNIPGLPGHAFFAVYDGHGGDVAAILSEQMVLPYIQKQKQYIQYCKMPEDKRDPALLGDAMTDGFMHTDRDLRPKLSAGDTSGAARNISRVSYACLLSTSSIPCIADEAIASCPTVGVGLGSLLLGGSSTGCPVPQVPPSPPCLSRRRT
jgi:hypothetical protein